MKGISLPINTIVIISIAALVLVVLATVFSNIFIEKSGSMTTETAFSQGCVTLKYVEGCQKQPSEIVITGFNPYGKTEDGKPVYDDLLTACRLRFNDPDMRNTECASKCGCLQEEISGEGVPLHELGD